MPSDGQFSNLPKKASLVWTTKKGKKRSKVSGGLLGIIKVESLSIMRQRPNHPLAMLNGLGFGDIIGIFVRTEAFTALITISVSPLGDPALGLLIITNMSS